MTRFYLCILALGDCRRLRMRYKRFAIAGIAEMFTVRAAEVSNLFPTLLFEIRGTKRLQWFHILAF